MSMALNKASGGHAAHPWLQRKCRQDDVRHPPGRSAAKVHQGMTADGLCHPRNQMSTDQYDDAPSYTSIFIQIKGIIENRIRPDLLAHRSSKVLV